MAVVVGWVRVGGMEGTGKCFVMLTSRKVKGAVVAEVDDDEGVEEEVGV